MKNLYLLLAKNARQINFLFYLSYVALVTFFVASVWMYNNFPAAKNLFPEFGSKFGQVSILLLITSMTPGILKRLGFFKTIESILVLFRRQIGILAFFTAFMHLGYTSWIRKIANGSFDFWTVLDRQWYGSLAIIIFFILWVISNDWSMKVMKGWWKVIQRLTYVAVIFLLFHLQFVDGDEWLKILLWAYLALEASSWTHVLLKKFMPNKTTPPTNAGGV